MNSEPRLNMYTCGASHRTVTIDTDFGTTPFIIQCPVDGCGKDARSSFYRIPANAPKPTHQWKRLSDDEIREELADAARQLRRNCRKRPRMYKDRYRYLSRGIWEHHRLGGLFMKPYKTVTFETIIEDYGKEANTKDLD